MRWVFAVLVAIWLPVFVIAADSSWKTKPPSKWSEEDARQVLQASPWSQRIAAAILPELTAGQRQAGGATGGGNQSLKTFNGSTVTGLLRGSQQLAKAPPPEAPTLNVRWESALPVRVAEMKAREIGAPDWEGDYYVIAVYAVPGLGPNRKGLAGELQRAASLRSGTQKDLKPSRVEVQTEADGSARLLYLFQRTEFRTDNNCIEFVAQFGRFSVAANFYVADMRLQNKTEL
jgi:hypothetical protein